jgi:dipeptidase E
MKLYLSSFKVGNQKEKLAEMIGKRKVALIPNAIDFKSDDPTVNPRTRSMSLNDDIRELESLGIEYEVLDLRSYFGKKEELEAKLKEFGGVYVRGGNSFLLRKAFKESGFDEILKEKMISSQPRKG